MPSAFDNRLDGGLNAPILAEFGVASSTYTPPSGSTITGLTVDIDVGAGGLSDGDMLDVEAIDAVASVKVSAMTASPPVVGGTFTVDSVDWTIPAGGVPHSEGGMWNCPVKQAGGVTQRMERDS